MSEKNLYEIVEARSTALKGPPVPSDLQQAFGWYKPGIPVTGIITLRAGIQVGFADGSDLIFIPQELE